MPLKILIVGAGPVGLAVAIALGQSQSHDEHEREHGHEIHIYEKSSFSREIGAAFHFAPQVHKILKGWGVKTEIGEELDPSFCETWRYCEDFGVGAVPSKVKFGYERRSKELGITEKPLMVHRIDAHDVFRKHALNFPNVHLHLSSAITSIDSDEATITLQDGSTVQGDLIIGADGIHSVTLSAFHQDDSESTNHSGFDPGPGPNLKPIRLPRNIYRFMVPTSRVMSDPQTRAFFEAFAWRRTLTTYVDPEAGRRITLYPCRGDRLFNCATFLPVENDDKQFEDDQGLKSWNHTGAVDDVLKAIEGYPEHFVRFVKMADEVKYWAEVGRGCPRTFVKGRVCLVGDAAHPMRPTHAAGAGTGIEEAATLGVLFEPGTKREEVEQRLELYHRLRYERGVVLKYASDAIEPSSTKEAARMIDILCPGARIPEDIIKYMWTADPIAEARLAMKGGSANDH